uniref:Xanthine dehydrogenase n=1 Tax=Macrostomum lignano TaxID=282301 RepID=A0A1I8JBK2_9PLAT
MAAASSTLVFYVNQNKIVEPNPDPEETLISYLRRKLLLTGTKLACGEGGCGACTVMLSRYLRPVTSGCQPRIENLAINACLAPLCSVHGAAVTTIEGIGGGGGGSGKAAHPIQERLAVCHGSQCGFCTPGMVMTAYALLRNHPQPTERQIDDSLQGNLCRCTGYRPILQGLRTFASGCCGQGRNCCRQGRPAATDSVNEEDGLSTQLTDTASFLPYDPSQEPIFPSELQLEADKFDSESLIFQSAFATWHRPTSLEELLKLKQDHPDAKIINGNTEVGVEVKSKKSTHGCLIYASHVDELRKFDVDETGIDIGAAVTLTELADRFKELITDDKLAEHKKRGLRAYVEMLHWFSGQQIRNVASHFGSESAAHELGAVLTFASLKGGIRQVAIDANFFVGYRCTSARPDEALLSIRLPFCGRREFQFGFKQARRREDDIAIVNAGMLVRFSDGDFDLVESATVCFGGVAPVTRVATGAAEALIGRRWSEGRRLVEAVAARLDAEFPLSTASPCAPPSSSAFYIGSVPNFAAAEGSHGKVGEVDDGSGAERLPLRPSWGSLLFERTPPGQLEKDPVGRPVPHASGTGQASGSAQFLDDLPPSLGEVFVYPVFSRHAAARLVSIDASAALALDPGVLGVLDRRDVPGNNEYGIDLSDDRIFADAEVRFHGETVAAVVATDRELARRASHLVRVEYADIRKPIVTISDAIREGSYFPEKLCRWLRRGGAMWIVLWLSERRTWWREKSALEDSCLVVPRDGGEFEVLSSTQNLSSTQSIVAGALGLPRNRVVARIKRIGGGFGGKEYRSIGTAAVAAVAAYRFGRPARCLQGWVNKEGLVVGLKADCYLNAGYSADISCSVCEYIILRMANCYNLGAVDIRCRLCRTNTPSNTAFRGFGAPQAMIGIETIMSRLASASGLTDRAIRELNFFRNGDVSIYGHAYEDRCWEECLALADYEARKAEVDRFNSSQSYRKRGLHITPLCYGIGFGRSFLQQAGALVNVYLDGSVLITHGGVEMGQGLHTKLLQVAARVLDLPIERLYISETATDKVPNTVSSAASMTTDLNAPAVMSACQQIRDRLLPYMHSEPKAGWDSWVNAAYMDGVSLSAAGFYHGAGIHMDAATMQGRPYNYYTFGAACSEVEIDLLTGDHVTRRSDIVMDLGASLNPAVDIGQIEGAFVQGMGLYTLEEQRFSPAGELLTKGPAPTRFPDSATSRKSSTCSCCAAACANSPGPCTPPRAWGSRPSVWPPPSSWRSGTLWRQPGGSTRAKTAMLAGPGSGSMHRATSERIRLGCADDIAVRHAKCSVLPENAVPWELKLGH